MTVDNNSLWNVDQSVTVTFIWWPRRTFSVSNNFWPLHSADYV